MIENLKVMQCGNCGKAEVKIYKGEEGLFIECCSCKNQTEVIVPKPKIRFGWVDGSDGLHTVF